MGLDPHETSHLPDYNRTIVVLAALTAVEFALAWAMGAGHMGFVLGVVVLCGLAAWKAVLVGRVFMHLRFEPRGLALVALSPVVLAAPLVLLVVWDLVSLNQGTAAFGP
jgi:caa(3)-type oxidase subunit IV